MKWLIGFVVLVAVASVTVATYVILDNRNPVPGDITACVIKSDIAPARSSDSLSSMRDDVLAGKATVTRRWDWGETKGVLIAGPAREYQVLALWNADTPSLAGAMAARKIYERPARFPLVALESQGNALAACAAKA